MSPIQLGDRSRFNGFPAYGESREVAEDPGRPRRAGCPCRVGGMAPLSGSNPGAGRSHPPSGRGHAAGALGAGARDAARRRPPAQYRPDRCRRPRHQRHHRRGSRPRRCRRRGADAQYRRHRPSGRGFHAGLCRQRHLLAVARSADDRALSRRGSASNSRPFPTSWRNMSRATRRRGSCTRRSIMPTAKARLRRWTKWACPPIR